jgi:glycosyltransferase involved in cell wall biosynthesis
MLNYFGNFVGELGYTVMTRELFKAMADIREDIRPLPYEINVRWPMEEKYASFFFQTPDVRNDISLAIRYGNLMHNFTGRKRIGYTMWETTRLPKGWKEGLNQLDEVWTMSEWGRKIMIDSGVEAPTVVIPGGVEDIFNPYAEPLPDLRDDPSFKFLSVFKWESRKSPDLLVEAFHEEFSHNEDVTLLLLAYNPFMCSPQEWPLFIYKLMWEAKMPFDDRVHFLPPVPQRPFMPRVYSSANAFVLPSKGEGFGLPLLEAMACGLPTIGTDWSGNKEFMNKDNSYLIEVDHMEPAEMPPFIKKEVGSEWAVPSKKSLRERMREVFDDREASKKKGLKASEFVHDNFEWKHAAKKAWERVDKL